ncbi:MAG: hypothetical protein Q4B94_05105 [Pseudomonadota bacterium]|nr:hypothetical protein [Pseudomonadota bacterium]
MLLTADEKCRAYVNCPQKLDTHPTFEVFFMAKYSEVFKLRVVQSYEAGQSGFGTNSAVLWS